MRVTALAVAANGEAELNCRLEPSLIIGSEWQHPDYGWDEADTLIWTICSLDRAAELAARKSAPFSLYWSEKQKTSPHRTGSPFGAGDGT